MNLNINIFPLACQLVYYLNAWNRSTTLQPALSDCSILFFISTVACNAYFQICCHNNFRQVWEEIYYSGLMFSRYKFSPCRILWLMSQNPLYIFSKRLNDPWMQFFAGKSFFCVKVKGRLISFRKWLFISQEQNVWHKFHLHLTRSSTGDTVYSSQSTNHSAGSWHPAQ